MSTIVFRGKGNEGIEFGVMAIPRRKQKALVELRGANIDVLGYFRSNFAAERFECMLNEIVEWFEKSRKGKT